MKNKKRYPLILQSLMLSLILGITAAASDITDATSELTEAAQQTATESQEIAGQVNSLAETDDGSQSFVYLQSLADICSETGNSLTETAYALQEEVSSSTQVTGSIMDSNALSSSGSNALDLFQQLRDQMNQPNPQKDLINTITAEIAELQNLPKEAQPYYEAAQEFRGQQLSSSSYSSAPMPEDMAAFFDAHGLTRSDDWSQNINELETLIFQNNTQIQNKMIELQNAMSEYNSYTNGILNSMTNSLHTMQTLNTGSIYNAGSTKLITTPVVTSGLLGLSAGILLTYLLLRRKKRSENHTV